MRRIPTALACALALGLAGCGGSGGETQSSSSASGEGASADRPDARGPITVYSGRDEELVGPLIEQYERASGQQVDVRYGDTAELASTLVEEGERSPADVFLAQDAGALGAAQQANLLKALPAATLEKVPQRYRSAQGRWVGASGRARVFAYDTRDVEEQELPRSVLEFTDPRWRGRVGWAPTNASFQSFVTALRATRGEEAAKRWLEGMKANDPVEFEKNSAARDAVADGEIDVALINHYYVAEARAEEGDDYPVAVASPPAGDPGALINVAGAGILSSTDQSRGSQRFVDFLLSREAQQYFVEETYEYPLVEGLQPAEGVRPLEQIQAPEVDLNRLADLPGTVELLEETGVL